MLSRSETGLKEAAAFLLAPMIYLEHVTFERKASDTSAIFAPKKTGDGLDGRRRVFVGGPSFGFSSSLRTNRFG